MKPRKILAVSSSGGHWMELLCLRPAFEGHAVVYVTPQSLAQADVPGHRCYKVLNANQAKKLQLIVLMATMFLIVLRERPDVVVSTGTAPGYFALRFGRMFGARTLWLESICHAEEHSKSTELSRPYADLLLTQWPHLARPGGAIYRGGVL
jgi:UDP-N-acetylglucosamine:LPS N-acetylglucosamine transferase